MSLHYFVWAMDQELPCTQKFVLVILGDVANQDGQCWPSQTTIAKKCGLSRSTVCDALAVLEELGYVSVENRKRARGGGDTSCMYTLRAPAEVFGWGRQPDASPGFLYISQRVGGIVKVGVTKNLDRRMKGLSSACGEPVELVKSYALPMDVARKCERSMKEALEQSRLSSVSGEWFRASIEVVLGAADTVIQQQPSLNLPVSDSPTPPSDPVSARTTPGVRQDDTGCPPGRHPFMNLPKEPPKGTENLTREARESAGDNPPGHEIVPTKPVDMRAEFEEWYRQMPRHREPEAAWRAYAKARKTIPRDVLLQGAMRYAAYVEARKQRDPAWDFVKYPATWLNKGCWADKIDPSEGRRRGSNTMEALRRMGENG